MIQGPVTSVPDAVIAGGGLLLSIVVLALVERLRRTFATRQDFSGLESRIRRLENLVLKTREMVDDARERASNVETEQWHQWERIAEQVIRPLERITAKMEALSEAQAVQATVMEYLVERQNRGDDCRSNIVRALPEPS